MKTRRLTVLLLAAALTLLCSLALADGLAFRQEKVEIFEGESVNLELIFSEDASAANLKFTSGAPKTVQVDQTGMITGLRKGTATITATSKGDRKTHKAQIKVQVKRAVTSLRVDETRLTVLSPDDYSLEGLLHEDSALPVLVTAVGTTVPLRATLLPKDATTLTYTAETSDPTVAVGPSGNLKILRPGECFVTLRSDLNPEVSQSYHLLAVQQVNDIDLTLAKDIIGVGFQTEVHAAIRPYNATIQGVTWASLNPTIAVVDENGVITGVSRGNARIRATAVDGSGVSKYVTVQVQQQPTGMNLDRTNLTIFVGKTTTLKATVQPSTASNKTVTWYTSDPEVCQVNSAGKLTPVGDGECDITCESRIDPTIFATCHVRGIAPVTSIGFEKPSVYIFPEEIGQLTWTVKPEHATDPSVTLTSSNPNIAQVTQDGVIYPVSAGSIAVTAKANDGSGVTGRCKVYVTDHITAVYMDRPTLHLGINARETMHAIIAPSTALNHNMTWTSSDPYVVQVRGDDNNPTLYGIDWGTAVVYGTTEEGGFTCSVAVRVGDFGKALQITDLYTTGNQIKISVRNNSDMEIEQFNFTMECYDIYGQPLICTTKNTNVFSGSYPLTLYEGQSTTHGHFRFSRYAQPTDQIFGHIIMRLTGYQASDGFTYTWSNHSQPKMEFYYDGYIGYLPTPVPAVPTATPVPAPALPEVIVP